MNYNDVDEILGLSKIGTVIATTDSPSTQKMDFVLHDSASKEIFINRGDFVLVKDGNRQILGLIQEIKKSNAYFTNVGAIKDFSGSGGSSRLFPTEEWEYTEITAKPLGEVVSKKISKVKFPVSPGLSVFRATRETLHEFLGLTETGLFLGTISTGNTPLTVDLTRLLRKHLAILAISGAGKSYAASVLIEEILTRQESKGSIPVILIDPHGEYVEYANTSLDVKVVKGIFVTIPVSRMNAWNFREFIRDMSVVQERELDRIISKLKKTSKPYGLNELIDTIEEDNQVPARTKEALLGWLFKLNKSRLFGYEANPDLQADAKPGRLLIIDLSETFAISHKQIICTYIARHLFELRRSNKIPPFLLIVEEAHQFCPEGSKAISKGIIEMIAREGRKFYASLCLISQRPVRLSSTALSQCNSHLILRIRNPYDLDYIGKSSEGIDSRSLKMLPSLEIGEALLVGNAINHPTFFFVRRRNEDITKFEASMEEVALQFDYRDKK